MMNDEKPALSLSKGRTTNDDIVGLCRMCIYCKVIKSAKGSVFYLCKLSERDPRYPKYPRLPVLHCAGYTPNEDRDH